MRGNFDFFFIKLSPSLSGPRREYICFRLPKNYIYHFLRELKRLLACFLRVVSVPCPFWNFFSGAFIAIAETSRSGITHISRSRRAGAREGDFDATVGMGLRERGDLG
jgi:hypothetical protein